jgi:hypothetical protein
MFKCNECGKKFKEKLYFEKHKNKEVPCTTRYPCILCNSKFKNEWDLKRHNERKTPCVKYSGIKIEETPLNCRYCLKEFANKSNVSRHMIKCELHGLANPKVQTFIENIKNEFHDKLNHLESIIKAQQCIIGPQILYNNHENIYIKYDDDYNTNLELSLSYKSQWLYFIKEENNNRVKIGYTKKLKSRISALQTGNSDILEIIAFIQTKDMVALETLFHDTLKQYRGIGEWFNLSEEQIIELLCNYRDTDIIDIKLIE